MDNIDKTSEQLGTALQIAIEAHMDQVDRGGAPYILHPLWVMSKMETDEERMVALMHDVLEDCPTLMINWEYFPTEVEEAVKILTRRRGYSYAEYIESIALDDLARKVKIWDLRHNLLIGRNPSEELRPSMIQRYTRALEYLTKVYDGGDEDVEMETRLFRYCWRE
jgi:hypothetical protein